MNTAYLGLGSNSNPLQHIKLAIEWLDKEFSQLALSPVYRSASVGFEGDDFINLVARIETDISVDELKQRLIEIEDANGRLRDVAKFSDRTLDIDILLFNDLVSDSPDMVLPREEILLYAHVLRPLAELAPKLLHPRTGNTMQDIWENFSGKRDYLQLVSDF